MRQTTFARWAPLGDATRQRGRGLTATVVLATALVTLTGCASQGHVSGAASLPTSNRTSTATTTTTARLLTVMTTFTLHQITHVMPTPTTLWVLGGQSRKVSEVDPRTNTVRRTFTLPHPAGFGTYASGSVWIASFADSVVMQVDPSTGRLKHTGHGSVTIPVDHPVGLVATGSSVWVVQHRKAILTRIDTLTGAVTGNTPLPGAIAGDPVLAAGRIWVTVTDKDQTQTTLVRVNPTTGRVDGPPLGLGGLVCGPISMTGGNFWVTSPGDAPCSNTARTLDVTTGKLAPTPYGPGKDLFQVVSVDGSTWAADTRSTIYRLDTATGRVTPALTLDGAPDSNQLTAAFGSLWVVRGDTGRLLRLRTS